MSKKNGEKRKRYERKPKIERDPSLPPKRKVTKPHADKGKKRPHYPKNRKPNSNAGAWKEAYLRVLSQYANHSAAAKAAGVSYGHAMNVKRDDKEFAKQCEEAIENALDTLEEVAWKAAHDGSVADRIFLLKARRGYRDHGVVEVVGKGGGPVEVEQIEQGKTFLLAAIAALRKQKEQELALPAPEMIEAEGEVIDTKRIEDDD